MLAQITRNNFFSMKGLRQKGGVCWPKKQEKITKLTKMWCVLAQITVNNFFYERTRTKFGKEARQNPSHRRRRLCLWSA